MAKQQLRAGAAGLQCSGLVQAHKGCAASGLLLITTDCRLVVVCAARVCVAFSVLFELPQMLMDVRLFVLI